MIGELEGFHPITSLPGDCMHDFLEGCCPLVLMALLKEASACKLITYGKRDALNSIISQEFSLSF